jgi:hypothetical protein
MRIPRDWLGGDVAVLPGPLNEETVTHRLSYYTPDEGTLPLAKLWTKTKGIQPKPRCLATREVAARYAEHSAAWVDQHGGQACPTCYPT